MPTLDERRAALRLVLQRMPAKLAETEKQPAADPVVIHHLRELIAEAQRAVDEKDETEFARLEMLVVTRLLACDLAVREAHIQLPAASVAQH